jgi:hypothetical protein
MLALAACSDASRDPTASTVHDKPDLTTLLLDPTVWDLAVVEAEYGSNYSLDSSPEGQALAPYIDSDQLVGYDAVVCRDHMRSAHLWWDSPNDNGLVGFHVNPPLRFHGYTGSFTDRRGLRWRKAVYSTGEASEGQDNAGNVWRFRGRFNAQCRMGQKQMGPLLIDAQLVFPTSLIDQPVLVRRGTGGGGCGGDSMFVYEPAYDPYNPYGPEDDCDRNGDGGGGDPGGAGGGDNCHIEYIYIEVFNGSSWVVWWEGNATVCE